MTVYSVQLGALSSSGTGTHTIVTAAASPVAVVRDIEIADASGGGSSALVTGPAGTILIDDLSLAANAHSQWTGRLVMNSLDTIKVIVVSGSVSIVVSGYHLT